MKATSKSNANTGSAAAEGRTPTILITGASGTVGTELCRLLTAQNIPFRVMVRSPQEVQKRPELAGAEIVPGDFDDPATVARALMGIERAFLLTNSSEKAERQQLGFVHEARRAGLRHIVKLSQFAAAADSPVRFLRYHAAVEQAIEDSGTAFTFLRPNLFMQGLLGFRTSIIEQGKFFAALGDAKISIIDIRDIAAAAAAALTGSRLTGSGHEGKVYSLTGPQALSHAEMADGLSSALGRPVTFVDVPPETMRGALIGAGFPQWQADGLIEDYAHYSRHEASAVTAGVLDATGLPPRSFAAFARDFAPAFLGDSKDH